MLSACAPPAGVLFPVSKRSYAFLDLAPISDAQLPQASSEPSSSGLKRSFLVPEKFSLADAVCAARDGDEILLQDGDYELSNAVVVTAGVSVVPLFKGNGSRVVVRGTWIFRSQRGGSVRGITCISEDQDCIRVEAGAWLFQDCSLSCRPKRTLDGRSLPCAHPKNFCALWCGGGEVTLQNCEIGSQLPGSETPNG
eukprot:1363788-Rhodomonas_salina.1